MVFDVMLSTVNYLGNLYYFLLKSFCQIRERKDMRRLVCKENSLIEDYAYTPYQLYLYVVNIYASSFYSAQVRRAVKLLISELDCMGCT